MQKYEVKPFTIPEIQGISKKQIEVHLKLYEGYVKFTNQLRETLMELRKDSEKNAYALGEVLRRFGFEFNGMRMHEYYFEQLEEGPKALQDTSALGQALAEKYGSLEDFKIHFVSTALMRGIGWTILAWDPIGKTPHVYWVNDHELGQLAGLPILYALDMWEHAFMVDYVPAEKKNYIESFWNASNWSVAEKRFGSAK